MISPDEGWAVGEEGTIIHYTAAPQMEIPQTTTPQAEIITDRTTSPIFILLTVGGVVTPVNKLEILTPYLALAGLIAVISTVVIVRKKG